MAVDNSLPDIAKAETGTLAALESAKGYIRHELKDRLGVRHVPDLAFIADRSGRYQARIEELLGRTQKWTGKQAARGSEGSQAANSSTGKDSSANG